MRVLNGRKEERYAGTFQRQFSPRMASGPTGTTIFDRLESGAKLRVAGSPCLPKMIVLVDFRNKSVLECEVGWSGGGHIGVQIIDEFGRGRRTRFFETHTPLKSQGQISTLLYRVLLIWTQSGSAHDPGVRDGVG